MSSLFCFLEQSKSKFDFQKFENLGVFLPNTFKLFCNQFELGTKYGSLHNILSLNGKVEDLGSYYIEYEESFYQWVGFISLDDLYQQYLKMIEINGRIVYHQEEYFDGKLFYIGTLDSSSSIFVGTTGDASDKIYIQNWNGLFLIAENIFDLCHKFEYKVFDFEFADTSKLYKNWGEDFWRVREKEE